MPEQTATSSSTTDVTQNVVDWCIRLRDQVLSTGARTLIVWFDDGIGITWDRHRHGLLIPKDGPTIPVPEDALDEQRFEVVE